MALFDRQLSLPISDQY